MTDYRVYRIQSGTNNLYLQANDLTSDTTKGLEDYPIPYTTERFLINERTIETNLTINEDVCLGTDKIYSTKKDLESAINNIKTATSTVTITSGSYNTSTSTFTADSASDDNYIYNNATCLVRRLTYSSQAARPNNVNVTVILEVGTAVY